MAKAKENQADAAEHDGAEGTGRKSRGPNNTKFSQEQLAHLVEKKEDYLKLDHSAHNVQLKEWFRDKIFPAFFEEFPAEGKEKKRLKLVRN